MDCYGYVRNREFERERFLVLVDLSIIQEQLEVALAIVMKHTIQLHSAMSFVIEMVFIMRITIQTFIAVSYRGLSTMNHHRFDQRSSNIQLFYPSFLNPILTVMIVLLLQILCKQSHDASHCGCGHRSSQHFHHAIVIITIRPTISSAQRFGRELHAWRHNIGLDGASAGTSARREIRDVVLSLLNSLGKRRSDGNYVLGEGRRRHRSKSA